MKKAFDIPLNEWYSQYIETNQPIKIEEDKRMSRVYYTEETYRGYEVSRWIGQDGYFVESEGDEIQFETIDDAEIFIDSLYQ